MNNDLFPEIVRKVEPPKADPCRWPYYLVAYYPRDSAWKNHHEMYESADCDKVKRAIIRLENNGWTHITVMRLPDSLWS